MEDAACLAWWVEVSVTAWKCTHNKLERELKEDDNDENTDDDSYLLLAFCVPENEPAR